MNDILDEALNTKLYYTLLFIASILSGMAFLWLIAIILGVIICGLIFIFSLTMILTFHYIKHLLLKIYIYFDLQHIYDIDLYNLRDTYYLQDLVSFSVKHGKVRSYVCLHQKLANHRLYMTYILHDHYHELKHNTIFISKYLSYLKIKDVMNLYLYYKDKVFIKHLLKNYNINLFFNPLNSLCPDIKNIIYQYYIKLLI